MLIGMVHVHALPRTPFASSPVSEVVSIAVEEARALSEAGYDAIILENMHDRPYLRQTVGPEVVSAMTVVAAAVRQAVGPGFPLGIQILAGANRHALAVALAAGLDFIRAEGFVFASVADEGLLDQADAGPLLRYRRQIGAEHIDVLADIKKKHSAHAITSDVSLGETAHAAEFFGADGVIVTGIATGHPTAPDDIREATQHTSLPVLVGSGIQPDTILSMLAAGASGLIVGSALKRDGHWANELDPGHVQAVIHAFRNAVSERSQ